MRTFDATTYRCVRPESIRFSGKITAASFDDNRTVAQGRLLVVRFSYPGLQALRIGESEVPVFAKTAKGLFCLSKRWVVRGLAASSNWSHFEQVLRWGPLAPGGRRKCGKHARPKALSLPFLFPAFHFCRCPVSWWDRAFFMDVGAALSTRSSCSGPSHGSHDRPLERPRRGPAREEQIAKRGRSYGRSFSDAQRPIRCRLLQLGP